MMVVNVHYSPGKMCHWPWLNVTWSSTQWSTEQNKPSLDGRSAECGSSPLQPHWQPLRIHLSSILSSQAPALIYAASLGQHSLTPCSQEDALSLTCRQGTACSLGGQQPVCQLEPCPNHWDRESSCSAASSRRCLALLLCELQGQICQSCTREVVTWASTRESGRRRWWRLCQQTSFLIVLKHNSGHSPNVDVQWQRGQSPFKKTVKILVWSKILTLRRRNNFWKISVFPMNEYVCTNCFIRATD